MQVISRESLIQRLGTSEDLRLVEVLPTEEFEEAHLPDAVSAPLADGFEARVRELVPDRQTPIITYCHNEDCPMSVDAAKQLDDLGYQHVYAYTAGKADWMEAGLPTEPQ